MSTTSTSILTTNSQTGTISNRKYLYLVGINVTHSIAAPVHNHIAASLSLPWQFINKECPTIQSVLTLFRKPNFAGGVVTMPYKTAIMPFLDELDPVAKLIGATNNVYLTREGKLRGTNTDWRGIKGCLLSGSSAGIGKTAMIIGAGGASRAAVYALFLELNCQTIYLINRDAQEVANLFEDAKAYGSHSSSWQPKLVHVTSVTQAESLEAPYYIVGTVPDFEAKTEDELTACEILKSFLSKGNENEKGVLLDMCFKPRNTRILKLAKAEGWKTVDGTGVIGHQFDEQWRLWAGAGEDGVKELPTKQAWELLNKGACESTAINF